HNLLKSKYGGLKEDYFTPLFISDKFERPIETIIDNCAFGNNDYGIDGYYIDKESKNLYLYQFKWSDNYELFKETYKRLIKDGVERIFGDPLTDSFINKVVPKLKLELQEYKLQVGNNDFYIDLLFYHRGLQCLVAFELKADKFKPDHLGQLNFYLEALDRDVKKQNENPSIGVLLCKDKDSEVVEYALSRSLSPTMVSEYKTQLPDKKLLQQKLHELFDTEMDDK
ncbi:MAG: PDDEXK nuclease domain-containing protein, partial [Bacteroidota bacterium]